jgi:hypothetical protein
MTANNIFAPDPARRDSCKQVYEDEHALAFHDINPAGPVTSSSSRRGLRLWDDFSERGSEAEIAGFIRAVGHVARSQAW